MALEAEFGRRSAGQGDIGSRWLLLSPVELF